MLRIQSRRSQIAWDVLSKQVVHIIVAVGKSLRLQLGEEVRSIVVALAHNLTWSEGKVGWEGSAEGVNQSLLLTELKLVDGEVIVAGRKFCRGSWEVETLEELRSQIRWDQAGSRSRVIATGKSLAKLDTKLVANLLASEELDLEVADGGLIFSWDSFKTRWEVRVRTASSWSTEQGVWSTLHVTNRHEFLDLVGQVVHLTLEHILSLKDQADLFLVVVLVLESLSLVLASSELILELGRRILVKLVLEIGTLGNHSFKLVLQH